MQNRNLTAGFLILIHILILWFAEASGGELRSSFREIPSPWILSGTTGGFLTEKGTFFYDSGKGNLRNYRWATLKSPEEMDGDFEVEFQYRIHLLDHWNGFALLLQADQPAGWTATLKRFQRNRGEEFLSCSVGSGKNTIEKTWNETGKSGTFRISRKQNTLIFQHKTEQGKWMNLFQTNTAPNGRMTVSLKFDSPRDSQQKIELINWKQKWNRDIVNAFAPVYDKGRTVCSEPDGTVRLVFLEHGQRFPDGTIEVKQNGSAVFAIQGGWNLRDQQLNWTSSGGIKLSAVQIGTMETIQLGETLLWDEKETAESSTFRRRRVGLEEFITRFQRQRNWNHPHISSNNLYFVTFQPSLNTGIRLSGLTLSGRPLRMIKPFRAKQTVKTEIRTVREFETLSWKTPDGAGTWFHGLQAPFPAGNIQEIHGVPFAISTTVLNGNCPSVELPVNRKSGIFHFLHTAGKQTTSSPWLAASYLIVYEDNSTETMFAGLRWNCGVFRDSFLPRGRADFTWWGPPGFGRAKVYRIPSGNHGVLWDSVYLTSCINPHPEKMIRRIIVWQMPEDSREFALLGISLQPPVHTALGLIEPQTAVFAPGTPLKLRVMEYSAVPKADGKTETVFLRKGMKRLPAGNVTIRRNGRYGSGETTIQAAKGGFSAGPVILEAGVLQSSLLGLMPEPSPEDKPFYLTMIAGGGDPRADFERIRRLGYDAVKIHLPWKEDVEGHVEWPGWRERFARIRAEGLSIGFRNNFPSPGPAYLSAHADLMKKYVPGKEPEQTKLHDPAEPFFRRRLVNYYRETARLANETPGVISINANYGIRNGIGTKSITVGRHTMELFRRRISRKYSLAELNRRTGAGLGSFDAITPEIIWNDKSRTLLPELTRLNMELLGSLQREVVEAIRAEGCKVHMTYNVPFHPTEHKLLGLNTTEYLKLSQEFGPGSIFHETSDRYCLSFSKWMLAKRTLGLPYGDEGNQNPPTYEHNVLAYQWMAMMQCWDSLYCQWWGGKPGSQNIAWLKPYHKLLFNADYLPDPVSLSFSLNTGFAESPDTIRESLHKTTGAHYSLSNILRVLNINADRYMVDEFPETDKNVSSRLLIDDNTRSLTSEFGDRIERFIRRGGTFLATFETDRLNEYAFFKRFGINLKNGIIRGKGVRMKKGVRTVARKKIGKGELAILSGSWNTGNWDPGESPEYMAFIRNLLTELGSFRPLVRTDTVNVFATPYRAPDGDLLIHLFNITAVPKQVTTGVAGMPEKSRVFDHGTETFLSTKSQDGDLFMTATVPALGSTILRLSKSK